MSFHIQGFELPDDEYAFRCSINGKSYRAALNEIERITRSFRKHGSLTQEAAMRIIDEVFDLASEAISFDGVNRS